MTKRLSIKEGDRDPLEIDLRQPELAALWGWLWPGAGHLYQKRYAKGVLFMVCILSTYFFGFALGGGRVVYASWNEVDKRWQYVCQVATGLPALPALVQTLRVRAGKPVLFNGLMAPPQVIDGQCQLAQWHRDYHLFFELGTLYTMIAGLLNVLAIYDAYAGPVVIVVDESRGKSSDEKDSDKRSKA